MIELKNISKVYTSKKGKNTVALNNISLKFDNKGLTFILGKSGSGKSTLLNVLGGLDTYDSGEMIILGKSSKDFSQAELDSYRNTYIGFVFQEFNIIEDYDVYENIALTLQLQQKKVDEEKINNLLERLDLISLKRRKVNELSGGQKQRVAIARALIKNPKIILADEPTGNLDSNTGKEVMNLLREISKEKLVIIVSHDNEMAQNYANRIIEVKDGVIINDIRRENLTPEESEQYKIIKSYLPLKDSFKLGIGTLKHKKIKLFFTILLMICTLLFLSIADTLSSFKMTNAHAKLLNDENEEFVQIEKYRFRGSDKDNYLNKESLPLVAKEENKIKEALSNYDNFYNVYRLMHEYGIFISASELMRIGTIDYQKNAYNIPINNLEIVETNNISKIVKEKIIGRAPNSKDEIVITNYLADMIIENGIEPCEKIDDEFMTDIKYRPKNYEELVNSNKTFYFGKDNKVKIVGIVNYDLSEFQILKEKEYVNLTEEESRIYSKLFAKGENLFSKIYVTKDFVDNLKSDVQYYINRNYQYKFEIDGKKSDTTYYTYPKFLNEEIEYYDGNEFKTINKLSKNEALIDVKVIPGFDYGEYSKNLKNYIENNPQRNEDELTKEFFLNYIKNFDVINKNTSVKVIEDEKELAKYNNIKIIGIVGYASKEYNGINYYDYEVLNDYIIKNIDRYAILVPAETEKQFKEILNEFPYNQELSYKATFSNQVLNLVKTTDLLKKVSSYVSIVLVIFTVFLISNFVVSSISYRKKEIGVLRALGAKNNDVIKIFIWEGIAIAIISGIITSLLLVFVTGLLNDIILQDGGLIITPFILGIRQFLMIFILVFLVTIIASIIPLRKMSKMKPIDAILKK